jgi:diadenosine tetraphosphatase ApaH/serine/threonine PP2A family protein phosphatase
MRAGGYPVRIAFLSDIHANREALDACLRDARRRGAERLVFLGDFVGYGADAAEVVARVAEEASRGAVAVKGNHDDALERRSGYFNDAAQAALDWAKRTLDRAQRAFLAQLPLTAHETPYFYVHASAARPERWDYVDSAAAAQRCVRAAAETYTFVGHLHDQMLYYEGARGRMLPFRPAPGTAIPVGAHRRWLAVVGSVGQPRDRNPAAAYALLDGARGEVTFLRVPYDHLGAARRIREAGLPESLAYRVELGI